MPEQREKIEEKFADVFIKYYNEKENKKKYAVVAYEEDEWDCPEISFEYKKATVIRNILGDNLYHLEEVGD